MPLINRILNSRGIYLGLAIEAALKNGVEVLYRPANLKLNERDVKLLPDMVTEPQSGLSRNDLVRIYLEAGRYAPWCLHGQQHETPSRSEKVYRIICFAEVSAKRRCVVTGKFAILKYENPNNIYEISGLHGKVYLHWLGSLMPVDN